MQPKPLVECSDLSLKALSIHHLRHFPRKYAIAKKQSNFPFLFYLGQVHLAMGTVFGLYRPCFKIWHFQLRENPRGSKIVSDPILSQYGVAYDL